MNKLFSALVGYRTYILVALGVLTVLGDHFHYISDSTEQLLLTLEGFGTVAALRLAISALEDKVLNAQNALPQAPSSTPQS